MASRSQVEALVRLGADYDEIGERLHIAPGLAYLIATGLPADGSDAPAPTSTGRPGALASSQHLANPQPVENATSRERVRAWIHDRVAADAQMRAAGEARSEESGD